MGGRRTIRGIASVWMLRRWAFVLVAGLLLTARVPRGLVSPGATDAVAATAGIPCSTDAECDDGQGCTADSCSDGACVNTPLPECVSCRGVYVCPPLDIVFLMDTSGSMRDEATALCAGIKQLVADLTELGVAVNPHFLGITEMPGGAFSCLTDHVVGLLGPQVPGDAEVCPFPNTISSYESWGPAMAIVAERFPWRPDATRLIVPISDEGPCDGSRPEGCNDPGDDRNAVVNAISTATSHGVIVSPIAGTGSDSCVLNLATAVANGTGGITLQTASPPLDFTDLITEIVLDHCSLDDRCDDQRVCSTNDRCIETVCVGTPIEGCVPCVSPAGCDDQDACTDEGCVDQMCTHALNYDESTMCCAPSDGQLTVIDDGEACTRDVCDAQTGMVTHPPAAPDATCVDGDACTLDDHCDGEGRCVGVEVGSVECSSNADCPGFPCDQATNRCHCGEIPQICLVVVSEPGSEPGCFSTGEDVLVNVELGSSTEIVVGGQFLAGYNPGALKFVDAVPGTSVDPASPFASGLMLAVDEIGGTVFYAVGIDIGNTSGTQGPALMARLRFRARDGCASDELCFLSQNPQRTILSNAQGHLVPFTTCCTGEVTTRGAVPTFACPASRVVNADPGSLSAEALWPQPSAGSECDGPLTVACSGTNSFGADVTELAAGGGRIPGGLSEFRCSALDSCGAKSVCEWTVEVQPTNTVEVDVQLSPAMAPGPVQRCIVFELYSDCVQPPLVVERTLEFGLPFNFPGLSTSVLLNVPAGQYACAVARDPLHSLRSVTPVQISGNRYVASFMHDPQLGGHWLISGDLDDSGVVDSLDEELFYTQNGVSLDPHTPCGASSPHADIDGDGQVNAADLVFIQRNFLVSEPAGCCSPP